MGSKLKTVKTKQYPQGLAVGVLLTRVIPSILRVAVFEPLDEFVEHCLACTVVLGKVHPHLGTGLGVPLADVTNFRLLVLIVNLGLNVLPVSLATPGFQQPTAGEGCRRFAQRVFGPLHRESCQQQHIATNRITTVFQ